MPDFEEVQNLANAIEAAIRAKDLTMLRSLSQ